MKHYVKSACDTLAALGFGLDHKDRVLRGDRWIYTHANEPEARLTVNIHMSEQAARTVVQRARQIVGLASTETGKQSHKARVNARQKADRETERRRAEAARAVADARAAERHADVLVGRRQQQVGELDSLMRGKEGPRGPVTLSGQWVTPQQIADEAGLQDAEVARAIDSGALEAYQVGKAVLVKPSDAREWLKSTRRSA